MPSPFGAGVRLLHALFSLFIPHSQHAPSSAASVAAYAPAPGMAQHAPARMGAARHRPAAPSGEAESGSDANAVRVPYRSVAHHIWLRARIDGAPPAWFVLDTGAGVTVLDRGYATRLRISPRERMAVVGMGGRARGARARVRELVIGARDGLALGPQDVTLLDLSPLDPALGGRAAGLIGFDVLKRFVVTVDPARRELRFAPPSGHARLAASELPMEVAGGVPLVQASIAGAPGTFLLDTGDGFELNLSPDLMERCERDGGERSSVPAGSISGWSLAKLVRVDELALGEWRVRGAWAALWPSPFTDAEGRPLTGIVGNAVLERYVCTFDAQRGALRLVPARRGGRGAL